MAENLIDLRRRIRSIKNTQKITRAMKTVSAAKLRKNVIELNRNRPRLEKIEYLLKKVGEKSDMGLHPLMKERETGDVIIVTVSADKGLCGAYNSHIFKSTGDIYRDLQEQGEEVNLIAIGKKIVQHLTKRNLPLKDSYPSLISKLKVSDAFEISEKLQELYLNHDIKRIEFIYTGFESSSRQEITRKQLFPISGKWEELKEEGSDIEYIFEPSPEEIFNSLLPKYINSIVYRILLEAAASENALRMIAMDLATRNASDMINSLTLTMNKLRQASITKELLEIITATEALQN